MASKANYNKMKFTVLQDLCAKRDLPTHGTKIELAARLMKQENEEKEQKKRSDDEIRRLAEGDSSHATTEQAAPGTPGEGEGAGSTEGDVPKKRNRNRGIRKKKNGGIAAGPQQQHVQGEGQDQGQVQPPQAQDNNIAYVNHILDSGAPTLNVNQNTTIGTIKRLRKKSPKKKNSPNKTVPFDEIIVNMTDSAPRPNNNPGTSHPTDNSDNTGRAVAIRQGAAQTYRRVRTFASVWGDFLCIFLGIVMLCILAVLAMYWYHGSFQPRTDHSL